MKTLKEDVMVSKEEQKESLVEHGLFDFVPVDMWRAKGNTFNADRVLRENLREPLLVGYTNNSSLPWNYAPPSQYQVGKQVQRRDQYANDAEFTNKYQSPRPQQQRDFIELQSFREFYANRLYNPTRYAGGFNSYNSVRA
jgi:hypothetical protein